MARTKPSYVYAVISVALVLYLMGLFALTAIHARKLVTLFKEKVDILLEIKPGAIQSEISRVVQVIQRQPFVKQESITFISAKEAEADMKAELGEESMLEDIPNVMYDVVRFNVAADFFREDSLSAFREQMREDTAVADVYIYAANVGNAGTNIRNLSWILFALVLVLVFAAVTLIHNTIRLALYVNRFVIKNQELVGASMAFIRRPYLQRGLFNGLLSAVLAILALMGTLWAIKSMMPDLEALEDPSALLVVFILIALMGVLISGLSTYLVVNKFLRMRVDDLY